MPPTAADPPEFFNAIVEAGRQEHRAILPRDIDGRGLARDRGRAHDEALALAGRHEGACEGVRENVWGGIE